MSRDNDLQAHYSRLGHIPEAYFDCFFLTKDLLHMVLLDHLSIKSERSQQVSFEEGEGTASAREDPVSVF